MWARFANILIGIWLMAAPAILSYGGLAAVNHRIVGLLLASVAIIAMWEVTRPLHWVNVPLGLWLIVALLMMGYGATARLNGMIAGVAVVGFALVPDPAKQQFGGGWSAIWQQGGEPPQP